MLVRARPLQLHLDNGRHLQSASGMMGSFRIMRRNISSETICFGLQGFHDTVGFIVWSRFGPVTVLGAQPQGKGRTHWRLYPRTNQDRLSLIQAGTITLREQEASLLQKNPFVVRPGTATTRVIGRNLSRSKTVIQETRPLTWTRQMENLFRTVRTVNQDEQTPGRREERSTLQGAEATAVSTTGK
uniref:Uncharacterized protein n=1 Tax=Branchiostoma floridae TaxID=7739 RepID=C3YQF6_BRAFL|eukprot:XP_002601474.1 hypothetical protein BRAFLDRAFT_102158 [Branchiostoma floridae]